jgi:hypothetical protein
MGRPPIRVVATYLTLVRLAVSSFDAGLDRVCRGLKGMIRAPWVRRSDSSSAGGASRFSSHPPMTRTIASGSPMRKTNIPMMIKASIRGCGNIAHLHGQPALLSILSIALCIVQFDRLVCVFSEKSKTPLRNIQYAMDSGNNDLCPTHGP